jgi:hypothetical protein
MNGGGHASAGAMASTDDQGQNLESRSNKSRLQFHANFTIPEANDREKHNSGFQFSSEEQAVKLQMTNREQ